MEKDYSQLGDRRKFIPFENRIKHCKPETINRYKEIVKGINEYDVNDRFSIPGETFSYKKERLVLLNISGKTLKVYFKLDPTKFIDSTIPIKNVSNIKKYQDIPSCLVIKSDLAARRAINLAHDLFKDRKIPKKN